MIGFHRFLIGTAILFCAVFAAWSLNAWRQSGDAAALVIGVIFVVGAAAFAYYLRHLDRFLWHRR